MVIVQKWLVKVIYNLSFVIRSFDAPIVVLEFRRLSIGFRCENLGRVSHRVSGFNEEFRQGFEFRWANIITQEFTNVN